MRKAESRHMAEAVVSLVGRTLRVLSAMLPAGILAAALCVGSPAEAEPVRGAGSTFAAPVIAKWAKIYKDARADGGDYFTLDWTVDYELVGSLAGVLRLDQPEMDFAATDAPVSAAELEKRGRQQFPIVMGGIAVVANLDGIPAGSLRLTGPLLADIYLGKIQNWSDLAIKAVNPDLALPDLRISVMHRQDGSGSTFVFTEYLSAVNADWKTKYGADTLVSWPLGTSAEGTRNLIAAVQATKGAISYAEYGQVERSGLPFASIQNRAGNFVKPDPAGVQAAANAVAWDKVEHFNASLTDQPGEAAYPISTATFAVVPVAERSSDRHGHVQDFFRLAFERGASDASALGYVPLPDSLVKLVKQYWDKDLRAAN
ncbi:phosphate ABC transporter substrate-binding protein PstS [Mesorhizobium sp. IMUNJ 23232]|uniref:phosphate ABC transporter substrate-binding protein PstS n=1 Tax=Mesorhizobium sp. IMUNJ 23232 TaxID=3376064 RepID=UPI0037AD3BB7